MHEAGLGVCFFWLLLCLVFLRYWGAIDGTDRWYDKQRKEWADDLAKWASTQANSNSKTR